MAAGPSTFRTKRDADAYLSTVRADMERGHWISPASGRVSLRDYATRWLEHRPDLRPRTVELYEGELRLHLPWCSATSSWRSSRRPGCATGMPGCCGRPSRGQHGGQVLPAAPRHPEHGGSRRAHPAEPVRDQGCRPGEDTGTPIASIPQVFEMADTIEPRFQAMVLVGAFAGLRLGEMLALTRERIDLEHGLIRVVEQYQELKDGTKVLGPPKSEAGVRTVAMPAMLKPELEAHLAAFSVPGKKGVVFCGSEGQPLRRASWYAAWGRTMAELGVEGMKPHDLRHTGNTLAAMTGASTKELMARSASPPPERR